MARIAGVNIPTNKKIEIALGYIYGIGRNNAPVICEKAGVPLGKRVHQLTESEVIRLREVIDADYVVEGDLRREVTSNIKHMMDIGSYKGLRHRKKLPVRGQRTHTNAKTRKGRSRPIAGKKMVTK